jgi:hypothetical protein
MCLNFLHDYKVTIHISEDELGNILAIYLGKYIVH